MRRFLTRLFAVTIAALSTAGMSAAQTNCAERDAMTGALASKYGESFAGGGMQSSTRIIEVWFSEEKGTWTILMTRADGTSCVMAAGTDWRSMAPGIAEPAGVPG